MTGTAQISDRAAALERLCLYHLLSAIDTARQGLAGTFAMTGTLREGRHKFELDGDSWASAWSPTCFVSVDADHERLNPDDVDDFAPQVPANAHPLFEKALSDVGGRASAVYWATDQGFDFRGDTDRFELLMTPMEQYFAARSHNLLEFFALEPTDLALAYHLLKMAGAGVGLDEAAVAELLGRRERTLAGIQLAAKAAATMMVPLGVKWPDPEGSARRYSDSLGR